MDFDNYKTTLTKGQSGLLEAVESRTLAEVKILFNRFPELNQDGLFTYILLVSAMNREHRSISKFLMKMGCSVKSSLKTRIFNTPLFYAVKMGDFEIFKTLWRKGASICDTDANEESALELAMYENKTVMIAYALNDLEKRSQEIEPECEEDVALFHAACWTSNLRVIKVFLSFDFSVSSRSRFSRNEWKGFTPIHFALEGPHLVIKAINFLLKYPGVDFNAQDDQGRTCVHLAFRKYRTCFFKSDVIECMMHSIGSQSINPVDRNGLSHFHLFCSMKVSDVVLVKLTNFIKNLIDSGVDVNSSVSSEDTDYPHYTALRFAIMHSSWEIQKLLLEHGANPSKTSNYRRTVLHVACSHYSSKYRLKIVKLLLRYGADPAAKDISGRTPLHDAFSLHLHSVPRLDESHKLLLSKNDQRINHTDEDGLSYLHIACTGDDLGMIKTLISNGALINSCVRSTTIWFPGYSALHFAVVSQQVKVVEFLLSQGANANCVAGAGVTSLHLACQHTEEQLEEMNSPLNRADRFRIIKLLIKYGASINAEDSEGRTPLMKNSLIPINLRVPDFRKYQTNLQSVLKELFTRQKKTMAILLHHGADINVCSEYHSTILLTLITNLLHCPLNEDLVKIALEKGADVDAVDEDEGITPLIRSIEVSMDEGRIGISLISLLLEYGANINGRSKDLETPLHRAIKCYSGSRHKDIIGFLLNYPGIDLNARNDRGRTPLHMAVNRCNHFLITRILDAGADINIVDKNKRPPFYRFLSHLQRHPDALEDQNLSKILRTIIIYVKKLMKLNLFVSDQVLTCYEKSLEQIPRDHLALMNSDIDREVKNLKSEKIDQYTSLFDLINKDQNSLANFAQNENLLTVIKTIHGGHYSIFGDIIRRQYSRACTRRSVLEPAKIALNIVTNVQWPHCCCEKILINLSDENLKDLIKSTSIRKRLSSESSPLSQRPAVKMSRTDRC